MRHPDSDDTSRPWSVWPLVVIALLTAQLFGCAHTSSIGAGEALSSAPTALSCEPRPVTGGWSCEWTSLYYLVVAHPAPTSPTPDVQAAVSKPSRAVPCVRHPVRGLWQCQRRAVYAMAPPQTPSGPTG